MIIHASKHWLLGGWYPLLRQQRLSVKLVDIVEKVPQKKVFNNYNFVLVVYTKLTIVVSCTIWTINRIVLNTRFGLDACSDLFNTGLNTIRARTICSHIVHNTVKLPNMIKISSNTFTEIIQIWQITTVLVTVIIRILLSEKYKSIVLL
jgi:hypothetical protein